MPLSGQWQADADHEKLQPSFQYGQQEDEADIDPLGIIQLTEPLGEEAAGATRISVARGRQHDYRTAGKSLQGFRPIGLFQRRTGPKNDPSR